MTIFDEPYFRFDDFANSTFDSESNKFSMF